MSSTGKIAPSTQVTWESQASSYGKVKTGKVIAYIPAWGHASRFIPSTAKRTDIICDNQSQNNRYLVAVEKRHKRTGELLRTMYYAPSANVLERQNADRVGS